jgi:hypothetical protein
MNATCSLTGKQVFASKSEAHRTATRMSQRYTRKPLTWAKGHLEPYRCVACGGFHVGHRVCK